MRLKDRVAIVTGGDRGIGRAIALRFAREGAHVAIANRDEGRGRETVREIEGLGRKAAAVRTDLRRVAEIEAMQVNAIGPGTIETDLNRATLAIPHERQVRLARIPMGRLGAPEDIPGAAVFLASDDSNYMTGQTIYVDGGRLA